MIDHIGGCRRAKPRCKPLNIFNIPFYDAHQSKTLLHEIAHTAKANLLQLAVTVLPHRCVTSAKDFATLEAH